MTNFKDTNSIKQMLSLLPPNEDNYQCRIGRFNLYIYPFPVQEHHDLTYDKITNHELVDVSVMEYSSSSFTTSDGTMFELETQDLIPLEQDSRFKNYQPIKYHEIEGLSDGKRMPLLTVCELIKYLYRLNKLSIFD